MPSARSRKGCEECRRRRRKCDEQRPSCGSCVGFERECNYMLKVVWGARQFTNKDSRSHGSTVQRHDASLPLARRSQSPKRTLTGPEEGIVATRPAVEASMLSPVVPHSLPNGISLPPRYRRLLKYFAEDVLASLSCHPEVHEDFRRALIPAALHCPQLLSSCLALSAAGLHSRGLTDVDGIALSQILEHLQSSGLALLRRTLMTETINDNLLATCLIWCLADVFTYRQDLTSWKVHLEGIKAILASGQATDRLTTGPWANQTAMKHLYQLYLSLQTLPFIPTAGTPAEDKVSDDVFGDKADHTIDGFLGYSRDLLRILQRVDRLARSNSHSMTEADMLLGELKGMIYRDANTLPDVALSSSLSPEYGQEFALCHRIFQQATLIHVYRRLYYMSSGSSSIRDAVSAIEEMLGSMAQGEPCHAWVAMAMPIFTIGCEAFTDEQKSLGLEMVSKLEACIGSLHVKTIRQALLDVWKIRESYGDTEGSLCAHQLLGELRYNIILF